MYYVWLVLTVPTLSYFSYAHVRKELYHKKAHMRTGNVKMKLLYFLIWIARSMLCYVMILYFLNVVTKLLEMIYTKCFTTPIDSKIKHALQYVLMS